MFSLSILYESIFFKVLKMECSYGRIKIFLLIKDLIELKTFLYFSKQNSHVYFCQITNKNKISINYFHVIPLEYLLRSSKSFLQHLFDLSQKNCLFSFFSRLLDLIFNFLSVMTSTKTFSSYQYRFLFITTYY